MELDTGYHDHGSDEVIQPPHLQTKQCVDFPDGGQGEIPEALLHVLFKEGTASTTGAAGL